MPRLCQIKASAGSGKTHELTHRFLQRLTRLSSARGAAASACALAGGDDGWGDIIAMTFTNAAATEMRERILMRLKSAALGLAGADIPLTQAEAATWVNSIVRDMGALNIRTIDSLLHAIVRASALELGIHPEFEPVFATDEALAPYLELVLERAWAEDARMRGLLRDACRALVLHSGATGFLAGDRLRKALHAVLDDVVRGELDAVAPSEILHAKLEQTEKLASSAAQALLDAAEACAATWNQRALAPVMAIAGGNYDKCDTAYADKPEASALFRKGSPVSAGLDAAYADFAAAVRQCRETRECLIPALRIAPFIRIAHTLREAFFSNRQLEGGLPALLVPRLAAQALGSEHGVSSALCRLGSRLTHFLVDEFQDTSREQWDALFPLVEDALARGGSLTWVGDVKQSIYGWRGGDPSLFDAVLEDTALRRISGEAASRTLPRNWRSQRRIVEHNNSLFSQLGSAERARGILTTLLPAGTPPAVLEAAVERLSNAYADASQQCSPDAGNAGLVTAESLTGENAVELGECVLDRLSALLRDDIHPRRPWSDILILVRTNAAGRLVVERLVAEGIPVITENSLLLAENPLIVQLLAFLAFLNTPDDDVAFWTVLTGSLVLEHPLAEGIEWDALHGWCAGHEPGALFLRFRERWPDVWARIFQPFYSQASLLTAYDAVCEWLARLEVERRFPEERTFVRRFLEVVRIAEDSGLGSPGAFLEYWNDKGGEEKAPLPESMDAVRVATIHKSKGLEAPCVIVPMTDFSTLAPQGTVTIAHDGLRVAMPNCRAAGDAYYADQAAQTCENIDLLYVAFTRARDELRIFRTTTPRLDKSGSLSSVLEELWNQAGYRLPFRHGEPAAAQDVSACPAQTPGASRRAGVEPRDRESPGGATRVTAGDVSAASATAGDAPDAWRPMGWLPRLKIYRNPLNATAFGPVDRGTLLHSCLEHLRLTGSVDDAVNAAINAGLASLGRPVPDADALRQSLVPPLTWFASRPETASWLERGCPEQSFLTADGSLLRVDLLVREPWGVLVLDYKSGQPADEHVRQVRGYLAGLAACGIAPAGAPVVGLLVYLDMRCFQAVREKSVSMPQAEASPLLPESRVQP